MADGLDIARAARARRDEVRAAFHEGCQIGSHGGMDKCDHETAWRYSRASRALKGNPLGADVIGILVVCSDPRAAGREAWRLAALDGDDAWIKSEGVRLTVAVATLRSVAGVWPIGTIIQAQAA